MHAIGSTFGPYKLLELIGQGGLGKVYKAIDQRNNNIVAVKFLLETFASQPRFVGIFHRELLIMTGLKHKHLVCYLDSYFKPPVCFIVCEYVEGWSLRDFMRKVGPLPPLVALSILFEVLRGIDYLHLHDVIHSDLSSGNILLDVSGRVRVTDFGLASRVDIEDYRNYFVGTPGYYSPEHVTRTSIDPRSDLYCAGLILYEMLTGERAIAVELNREEVIQAMKKVSVKKITANSRSLRNSLRTIAQDALQFNLSRRVANCEQMLYDVFRVLEKYDIRYTRQAILQFLADHQLVKLNGSLPKQSIYDGFAA